MSKNKVLQLSFSETFKKKASLFSMERRVSYWAHLNAPWWLDSLVGMWWKSIRSSNNIYWMRIVWLDALYQVWVYNRQKRKCRSVRSIIKKTKQTNIKTKQNKGLLILLYLSVYLLGFLCIHKGFVLSSSSIDAHDRLIGQCH